MDSIIIVIVWVIVSFVLPKIFGAKKPQKPYEYPDETSENQEAKNQDIETEAPWYTWGLPEEAEPQAEELPLKQPENVAMPAKALLKRVKPAASISANKERTVIFTEKTKKPLNKQDLKRGLIMAELLGKPRSLNPYADKF
ncbi:MAG TPA: hypothetical protein IAB06_00270 [Candidatus Avacidaminococcus intestinavium]|uniref:Uncharacterized protein n=1 Tax=Candidatus Avacidaminococcus intestinavium TaxID=2840684 RepID=A0A9D1MNX5_9FIRM|nr:hypothetical protein [Candidatus Avacidaminococcus intestinavium]